MEAGQSLSIVRSLANGVDPQSGEVFSSDSPYQRADVVRALYHATEALERQDKAARRRGSLPAKAGAPWTEDEDRKLLSSFDAGRGLAGIAAAHERTQTGVRARLVKYGRLAA
ncbi:MAG: hypothetical protein ACT4P9_13105 [Betaproteobacteria bacterium]